MEKTSVHHEKRYAVTFPSGSVKEMIKKIIHENWVVFIFIKEETRRLNSPEMTY